MKKNQNKKKNQGYLFWITGLPGSGKSTIAKKIEKYIRSNFGPCIIINGDDLRRIFKFKGYSKNEREEIASKYCELSKFLVLQKLNVIFASVSLFSKIRDWNRKNIKNYIEIYIKSDLKKIIKSRRKKLYFRRKKNMVGLDIKPEFPNNPNIIIKNNFDKTIDQLSKELKNKLNAFKPYYDKN